jgi:hypothetical protein
LRHLGTSLLLDPAIFCTPLPSVLSGWQCGEAGGKLPVLDATLLTFPRTLLTFPRTLATFAGTLATLGGTLATLGGTLATLDGTLATLDGTLATLAGTLATLDGTLATLAGTLATLAGTLLRSAGLCSCSPETLLMFRGTRGSSRAAHLPAQRSKPCFPLFVSGRP